MAISQRPVDSAEEKKMEQEIASKKYTFRAAETCSGIKIKPVYRPEDVDGFDYERDLGDPGQYPFTRGIHPTMYRTNLWTFRQYSGFGTAEDTNARYRFLIEKGQTGLSIALDLPTQMGLDSDDPRAYGEVGKVGVAVDTLADMEKIFHGIDLSKISTSITINAISNILLAMYIAVGEKQEVPLPQLRGTVQNDILKEYMARGTWVFPVRPAIKMIGDTIEFCARNMPRYNAISISGPHIRSAGADDAFSIACTFKNAEVYIEEVLRRGLPIDDFAPNLSFIFGGDMEFFENICKLRAARRLWARMMKEKYGAKNTRSMMLRFAGGGLGGYFLTRTMPLNNIVRITLSCLEQVLGGSQSPALPQYDEAYSVPTAEAAKTTLMVQAIIAHETGIPDVVDPLAGSYYVEWLTNQMEQRFLQYMDLIDSWGGVVAMVESGQAQREIARQAYLREKALQSGELPMVGVNIYTEEAGGEEIEVFRVDPAAYQRQIDSLREVKAKRDGQAVKRALAALRQAAERDQENLMPYVIDAVKTYATVGEITLVLKDVYGEFREPAIL